MRNSVRLSIASISKQSTWEKDAWLQRILTDDEAHAEFLLQCGLTTITNE